MVLVSKPLVTEYTSTSEIEFPPFTALAAIRLLASEGNIATEESVLAMAA